MKLYDGVGCVKKQEAQMRHARYYCAILDAAEQLYLKGGENIRVGLQLFDMEWSQIQLAEAWLASQINSNDKAANLASRYAGVSYCLELRLTSEERIIWMEVALHAARIIKDKKSEVLHLGNLEPV